MTSKGCDDKTRYSTREEAMEAINGIIIDRRPQKSKTKPKKIYHCPFCLGFHIYTEGKRRIFAKKKPKDVVTFKTYKKESRLVIRNFSSKPVR